MAGLCYILCLAFVVEPGIGLFWHWDSEKLADWFPALAGFVDEEVVFGHDRLDLGGPRLV